MRLYTVLAVLISALSGAAAQTVDYADLARRVVDLDELMRLPRPGEACVQASSHDRSGGNADAEGFISVDKDAKRAVMAEFTGPGAVMRMWSANPAMDKPLGNMLFYFDGEDSPRLTLDVNDFFHGRIKPFVEPLTWFDSALRGSNCYVPIPFAKALKIVLADYPGNDPSLYYQIQAIHLADGETVESYDPAKVEQYAKALAPVAAKWRAKQPWRDPAEGTVEHKTVRQFTGVFTKSMIDPPLFDFKGAGIVRELRIRLLPVETGAIVPPAVDPIALRTTWLSVKMDGEGDPAVFCPLGDLFGATFGSDKPFEALPCGWTKDGGYLRWPMPFSNGIRIRVVNFGQTVRVEATVLIEPRESIGDDVGRFHARWRRELPTAKDQNFVIAKTTSTGRYVGCAASMQALKFNAANPWGFLEGDEMIYVDGEESPSIYGTGTEDFFGGAWYFWGNRGDRPTFGVNDNERDSLGRCGAYRFQIGEAVPFHKSIRVTIEHGMGNQADLDEAAAAFWYQKGVAPLEKGGGVGRGPAIAPLPIKGYFYDDLIEAEKLKMVSSGRGSVSVPNVPFAFVSGGKFLRFSCYDKTDELVLALPDGKHNERMEVWANLVKSPEGGQVVLGQTGWAKAEKPFDTYGDYVSGLVKLVEVGLPAGKWQIGFQVPGANPNARGMKLDLDAIRLLPADTYVKTIQAAGPVNIAPANFAALAKLSKAGADLSELKLAEHKINTDSNAEGYRSFRLLSGWNQNAGAYVIPLAFDSPDDEHEADLRVRFGGGGREESALYVEGEKAEFYRAGPSVNFVNDVGHAMKLRKGVNRALLVIPLSANGRVSIRLADPKGQVKVVSP